MFSSLASARVALRVLMWVRVASLALLVKTAEPAPYRDSVMSLVVLQFLHTSKAKSLKAPFRIMKSLAGLALR